MRTLKLLFAIAILAVTSTAHATSCTSPGDWIDAICRFPPIPTASQRCWDDPIAAGNMAAQCAPNVSGCEAIGGCFGTVGIGHWIVTSFSDGTIRRCHCGCFAEDTRFAAASGELSGSDLIAAYTAGTPLALTSMNSLDGRSASDRPINFVVWGPEKQDSWKLTTAAGRSIILTSDHPVVTGGDDGRLESVRKPSELTVGQFLVAADGAPDRLVAIERVHFGGNMVNLNIASDTAEHHVVVANGLKMGDNAWQQFLAVREARLMTRNDILREVLGQTAP